jgi:O-antigen ligase
MPAFLFMGLNLAWPRSDAVARIAPQSRSRESQYPTMPLLHPNAPPSWLPPFVDRIELVLIAAMAVLLPFDHWFFGHLVNPAPTRVLGFVLAGIWLLQILARRTSFKFEYWHAFLLAFLAICFYSAIFSPVIPNPKIPNFQYKIVAATKIVTAMLFLVLACHALDRQKILVFLRVHIVVGVLICAISLVLYILHLTRILPNGFALWVEPDIYTFVRIQGVSYEPHRFGAYTMTLIPWLVFPELRRVLGWKDGVALLALGIVFFCLIFSFAIGTYVALPVLLLLLAGHSQKNLSMMLRVGLLASILFAVAMKTPFIYESVLEVIEVKMRSKSLIVRLYQWSAAWVEAILYPWTGVGPEAYSFFLRMIDKRLANVTTASHPPQSMLLGILANTGLPGIFSFLLFMLAFLIGYIVRYRKSGGDKLVSYAAFAIAASHFVYQQSIWLPWSLNQWLFMAMAWAALESRQKPPAAQAHQ